jgi:UDP-N-acetylmuramoyl-tripeptide--D-alanyl-D-alanine ligase
VNYMYLSNFLPNTLAYFGVAADVMVTGFSIDSRSVNPGDVFIAIKGENFDGNDFIASAVASGAVAVISEKDFVCQVPVIKVDSARIFVQEMARHLRSKMTLPVVAITGSTGKTTTKNFLANILRSYKEVLATSGNFNSLLGMPLTMLNLRDTHSYGVFELGTDSAGEIAQLAEILRPNIGVITNIGRAHLAGIGDNLDEVAKEKSSLFANLSANEVAIINCDDRYFGYMHDFIKDSSWYGFTLNEELWQDHDNKENILLAKDIKCVNGGYIFTAVTASGSLEIALNMLGQHNIANALAAIAVAKYLEIPDENILAGIYITSAATGRLSVYENSFASGFASGFARVIDDSYNANPESCKAAIATLCSFTGKKILVLGDMLELGINEVEYHREIGAFAKQSGIDKMFCYGDLSHYSAAEFGVDAAVYSSQQDLLRDLKMTLNGNWNVLVKGSAALKMSNISAELIKLVK